MLQYVSCNNMDIEKAYDAFRVGFSDYMIQMEIDKDTFIYRFFGPEGNQLDNSFIVLDGDKPIGLILGGIKNYEGVKTMRCGTLCVHPDYRGKGVSKELFRLHKEAAINKNCKQMFLEVIVGNDRAIQFYKNLGYDKVYDLSYFNCGDMSKFQRKVDSDLDIRNIDPSMFSEMKSKVVDIHINWQNDFDYMAKLEGLNYYGAYKKGKMVGSLCISPRGKIIFIYTEPKYRNTGIAKDLIVNAVNHLNLSNLNISFPNNASIEGFVKYLGFHRDKIAQYEMYLTLR